MGTSSHQQNYFWHKKASVLSYLGRLIVIKPENLNAIWRKQGLVWDNANYHVHSKRDWEANPHAHPHPHPIAPLLLFGDFSTFSLPSSPCSHQTTLQPAQKLP